MAMQGGYSKVKIPDNGGRRAGADRRKTFIPGFIPERRTGQDRRCYQDRRTRLDFDPSSYLRRNTDRYMEFANTQKGMLYGLLLSLPLWALIIFMFFFRGTAKL